MGILPELVRTLLHLCYVGIDMAILLLFLRIVGQWRRIAWVERINDAARGVVDPLHSAVSGLWQRVASVRLSPRGALAVSVVTLCTGRALVCGLAGLLT